MDLLIILIISVLLLIVWKNVDSVSKRIYVPYILIWGAGLYLSRQGINGMFMPHDSTIIILLVHLMSFTTGYLYVKINPKTSTLCRNDKLPLTIEILIKNKLFKVIFYITLFYCLYLLLRFTDLILFYGAMGEFRQEYFEGGIYGKLYEVLNPLVLLPFVMILMALFGYLVINRSNIYTYLIGLYLLVHSSLKAGRGAFVNIILAVVYSFFCMADFNGVHKKSTRKLYILIIGFIVFIYSIMSFMSIGRDGNLDFNSQSLKDGIEMTNEHVVSYVSGPIVAFDIAIRSDWEQKIGGHQYGRIILAPFDDLLYYLSMIMHPILGTPIHERPIVKVAKFTQESFDIGNMSWNALYTSCFYYYLDFGIIGVLVIPFIMGVLVRLLIKKFYQYQSFSLYSLLCMVFLIMINSIQRLFFYEAWNLILVIILLYMGTKVKYVINKC